MPDHNDKLQVGFIHQCCKIDENKIWKSIAHLFTRYDVIQMKMDFYKLFRKTVYGMPCHTAQAEQLTLTFAFVHIHDFIDQLYVAAIEEGAITASSVITPYLAPRPITERRKERDPIFALCSRYQSHEIKHFLWQMFQGGMPPGAGLEPSAGRKQLMVLYESLSDLVLAGYLMYYGKVRHATRGKKTVLE